MTTSRREFGRPPSLKDMLARGKEFTDAAMDIEIDSVLHEARYTRKVGSTAARLSGVSLQREGDADSKRLVFAAYDNIYDLMRPSLQTHGADMTEKLFDTDLTRRTLLDMSRNLDSYSFSRMAYDYQKEGDYFEMTNDGLMLQKNIVIPHKFEARRGGCPYAKTEGAPYFNRFADHIVATYAEAHRRDMPDGWRQAVGRLITRG
jgi:hypothetical protein